jgi:hypothetical protein
MRLPFSARNEKLETMNHILTDAARERAERVEELVRQVAQLERESEAARKAIERAKVLEVVAAEHAHLLNEKDKELAVVREAATKSWNAPGRNWREVTELNCRCATHAKTGAHDLFRESKADGGESVPVLGKREH